MRAPESLGDQHLLEAFDCGEPGLNRWLQQRARHNERAGVSRTVVLCPETSNRVIAYVCLSAGALLLAEVPGTLRRNMPNPLPVVVLGRLAVDRNHQQKGLGRALVGEAVRRSLEALHEQAAAFYRRLGFRPSPFNPLTLMLQLG